MASVPGEAACNICGRNESRVFVQDDSLRVVKCQNDGLIYRDRRPTLAELMTTEASLVESIDNSWFDYRQKVLSREATRIKKLKATGNLLDIGCATGSFFENFMGGEWSLYGVEISQTGAEAARSRYRASVYHGTVREAQYPEKFFDLITIMDSLYYSPNPKGDLTEAKRILKDDGVLAVEIPGFYAYSVTEKGLVCRLLHKTWARGFLGPYRLYYFSPRSLRLLLQSCGFHIVEMTPWPSLDMSRRLWRQLLCQIHYGVASLVLQATGGKFSVAGREMYLAIKQS